MHVDLAFLGPVRHVPPRARRPRVSLVPMSARVELRELSWDDTEPGPALPTAGGRRVATRLVGGEAWRVVGADEAGGRRYPDAAAFRGWLEGDPASAGLDRGDVPRAFAMTPLAPRPAERNVLQRPRDAEGAFLPGLVLRDLREAAEAAALDLLARDVALVSGIPMARMRGPMACRDGANWRIARLPGAWAPLQSELDGLYHRLDRLPRATGAHLPSGTPGYPAVGPEAAALRYRGDEDVALTLALAFHRLAWPLLNGHGDAVPVPVRERVLDLAAAATAGLLPDEELPVLCGVAEEACALLERARSDRPGGIGKALAYLRGYAIPLLADRRAPDGPDAEALAGLVP